MDLFGRIVLHEILSVLFTDVLETANLVFRRHKSIGDDVYGPFQRISKFPSTNLTYLPTVRV
jgi:hypothetical protein